MWCTRNKSRHLGNRPVTGLCQQILLLTWMFYSWHHLGYIRNKVQPDECIINLNKGKNLSLKLIFRYKLAAILAFDPFAVHFPIWKWFHCIWHARKHIIKCKLCHNRITRSWKRVIIWILGFSGDSGCFGGRGSFNCSGE